MLDFLLGEKFFLPWRLALVKAGNARAKEGSASFWGWLVGAARGVRPGDLLTPLLEGLD